MWVRVIKQTAGRPSLIAKMAAVPSRWRFKTLNAARRLVEPVQHIMAPSNVIPQRPLGSQGMKSSAQVGHLELSSPCLTAPSTLTCIAGFWCHGVERLLQQQCCLRGGWHCCDSEGQCARDYTYCKPYPTGPHACKACSSCLTGSAVQDTSDIYQSTPGGHENEHLVGEVG